MANYLFVFRGKLDPESPVAQEAVWRTWFESLGPAVVEWGHRVGTFTTVQAVGAPEGSQPYPPTGYIVVKADSLDAAAGLARGCPILQAGGQVEVGETFD